jgi:hypothetical protein
MCGEDVECLATLGQRADARWVLAWGFGKVGSGFLFTSLLVETPTSTKRAAFTEKVPSADADASPLAARAVTALFQNVSRVVEEPKAPAAERRFLAPTVISGGAAVVGVALTVIFGVMAANNYGQLQNALLGDRAALVTQQRSFNLIADVSLGAAVVTGATALILFILGTPPPEPAAEVRP